MRVALLAVPTTMVIVGERACRKLWTYVPNCTCYNFSKIGMPPFGVSTVSSRSKCEFSGAVFVLTGFFRKKAGPKKFQVLFWANNLAGVFTAEQCFC